MVPSSEELLASVRHGLTTQVAPHVTDRLALSVLKSVDAILQHLEVRIGLEPSLLAADNAELRRLLGIPDPDPVADSVTDVSAVRELGHLRAENRALRSTLDAELDRVQRAAASPALRAEHEERLAEIDEYLKHRLEREAPLIFPAFAGRVY